MEDACVRELRQYRGRIVARSSRINGKLPALRFPISLQLHADEPRDVGTRPATFNS